MENIKNILKKITDGFSMEGITKMSKMDKKNRKTGTIISVFSFLIGTFVSLLIIGKLGHALVDKRSVLYWMTRFPFILFSMFIGFSVAYAIFTYFVRKPLNSQIEGELKI